MLADPAPAAPVAPVSLDCSKMAYTEYTEPSQLTRTGSSPRRNLNHVLIPFCFCHLYNLVVCHMSTGSDVQQENPQDSLREHLKKTLEFCLSR